MLGPAIDGGYYLLGVKQVHPRLFEDIAWSTSRLAAQTIDRAREISLHVHVLAPRYDVDDADTLSMLHGELAYHAAYTEELMNSLVRRPGLADWLGTPALAGAAI